MKKILFLTFSFLADICCAADGGELLRWMIMSTTEITVNSADGSSSTTGLINSFDVNGARIRYVGSDGSSGYLPIIGVTSGGNNTLFEGAAGVGVPGGYYASLGSYTGDAYSYVLELGNWSSGSWTGTAMESKPTSYAYLNEKIHIAQWEGMTPSYARPWTPTEFTVVPEPTGGLLVLVGGALLALRRSRQKVV